MNWFKGSISEAISEAKRLSGIFVVYIYDKSDLSKSATEKLNNEELSKILCHPKFVAIQIENGSIESVQFAQIYPLIVIPSLFFINPQNGIPLEVIGGNFDVKTLIEKIRKITDKEISKEVEASDNVSEVQQITEPLQRHDEASSQEETNIAVVDIKNNTVPECSSGEASGTGAVTEEAISNPLPASGAESIESPSIKPLEERLERAKELINQRQEMKVVEEIEEEKQKELERRRQAQEVLKAKQRREDQERLELSRQRHKEKEEDKLARARVKAQIAADRAERQARNALLRGEQPPPASAAREEPPPSAGEPPQVRNRSDVARIRFRFPDGSCDTAQFPAEATLADVRAHLASSGRVGSSAFRLVATAPGRSFSDEHMTMTLVQLSLTPSAIVIVKTVSGSAKGGVVVPSSESVMALFWSLLAPLTFLFNYLRRFLGLTRREEESRPDSSDEDEALTAKRPRTEGSYTTRHRPKTAYGRRGDGDGFLRREGNVHRLNRGTDDEDDDENNTWNGNSTQQM